MPQPALIVAHPGHELMVFGWVEETSPRVSILTDGSGRKGASRIHSSEKLLRSTNARAGCVWGAITDQKFYEAVLGGDLAAFIDLAVRLGDDLAETRPSHVVGDAREGFNPTHDICRMIIDAAIQRARRSGAAMGSYSFFLFAPHDRTPVPLRDGAICLTLDAEQTARKLAAARAYPELAQEAEAAFSGSTRKILAQHPDLAEIVDASIAGMSESSFSTEYMMRTEIVPRAEEERPFYELYGEKLVAAGTYPRAIRYREHVQPIERALAAL